MRLYVWTVKTMTSARMCAKGWRSRKRQTTNREGRSYLRIHLECMALHERAGAIAQLGGRGRLVVLMRHYHRASARVQAPQPKIEVIQQSGIGYIAVLSSATT